MIRRGHIKIGGRDHEARRHVLVFGSRAEAMFVSEKGMVWREMRMGRWEALARPGLVHHGKGLDFVSRAWVCY